MLLNGCSLAMAKDMTNKNVVTVTDTAPWVFGHKSCILVNVGTQIVFNDKGIAMTFVAHPLVGGVTGVVDNTSPITIAANQQANNKPQATQVTIPAFSPNDSGKAFPYYCTVHLSSMQGVIYVK